MTRCLSTVLVAFVFLVGCEGERPPTESQTQATSETQATPETQAVSETPAQALGAIIALYESRDFATLIRTRYAEIDKAENEEQVQSLIDRFSSRFESDEALGQAIATFESAREGTPELTQDGTVATFNVEGGFIKLSRMADGTWGFHL
jgi:hypothetical protein